MNASVSGQSISEWIEVNLTIAHFNFTNLSLKLQSIMRRLADDARLVTKRLSEGEPESEPDERGKRTNPLRMMHGAREFKWLFLYRW
jgi:hypothetical protein